MPVSAVTWFMVPSTVDSSLVGLRLERLLDVLLPVSEHSLEDGAVLRQASARREDSRKELVETLLQQMRRGEAAA